jgi:hypothetical protein
LQSTGLSGLVPGETLDEVSFESEDKLLLVPALLLLLLLMLIALELAVLSGTDDEELQIDIDS